LTICFFIALWKLFRNKEWRFLIFIGLWTLPIAIFLPFWGMDFSRLCVPILPPLLFTLVRWLDNVSWIRYKYVSFLVVLIASHLTLTLTTPLLIKFYPFKTFYQNRPITLVPIEPIFSDYFLRRDYLEEQQRMVRQVIQRTDRNVVIISDGHHFPWYEYELLIRRKALCSPASVTMKDSDWLTCSTGQNTFYAQVIEWQSSTETVNNLILLLKKDFQGCLFHINSFMASMLPNRLFLDKSELVSVLEKNPALINQYREIFQVPAPIKNQSSKEKNGQKN
jgi:hypothetical protein